MADAADPSPKRHLRARRWLTAVGMPVAAAAAMFFGTTNAYAASMIFPFASSTPDWYCGHSEQSATVRLVFQCDGNLVLYRLSDGRAVWDTATEGTTPGYLDFSGRDGEIVMVDSSGAVYCMVGAVGANGSETVGGYADIQDDGNFVFYNSSGQPKWATGTYNNRISTNDGCHG